jgi:hypothetical protein
MADEHEKLSERRPYVAPAIEEEQVFERQALQACDKTPADGPACSRAFPPPPRSPNVS